MILVLDHGTLLVAAGTRQYSCRLEVRIRGQFDGGHVRPLPERQQPSASIPFPPLHSQGGPTTCCSHEWNSRMLKTD